MNFKVQMTLFIRNESMQQNFEQQVTWIYSISCVGQVKH